MDKKTTIDTTNMDGTKQQYLNKEGLAHFLGNLKTYIEDRIKLIYGTNICISEGNEPIKDYIDSATYLDNGTSIKGVLEGIVGEYVKSIEGVSDDENINKYLKVSVRQKKSIINKETGESTPEFGRYEIYLEDTGFNDFVDQGVVSELNIKHELTDSDIPSDQPITDISNNEYVNLSIDKHHGSIELTLDESALVEKLEEINGYSVNGKSFIKDYNDTKGSIVLDASDIKMGIVGESETGIKGEDNLQETIINLALKISALGKPLKIKEIHTGTLEDNIKDGHIQDEKYEDGDVIIVGQKEYIYWKNAGVGEEIEIDDNGNTIRTNWILLGDVSQIMEQLEDFHSEYINHIHSITLEMDSTKDGSGIECDFVGGEGDTKIVAEFEDDENKEKSRIEVSYINSTDVVTKLPEFENIELPAKEHTHSTSITPSGVVDSTFTGHAHTHNHDFEGETSNTADSNLTINYNDASCTLSILTSHNHLYTPIGTITDTTITPSGDVKSTFEGTEETWESEATESIDEFYNKKADGETVTVVNTEMPGPGHTHKFTPEGNVSVKIDYTKDTETPSSQSSK